MTALSPAPLPDLINADGINQTSVILPSLSREYNHKQYESSWIIIELLMNYKLIKRYWGEE